MERLMLRDLRRLLGAVRELYASADLDAFPARVLTALPHVVPSDLTGYNEVDTREGRVTGRLDPAGEDEAAVLRNFARYMHEHPVLEHVKRTGDGSALRISDFLTRRQFRRRGLYREFYRPLGIEHQMAISFRLAPSLVIGLALNRGGPDFSERDRLLLNLLQPHLVQAYQNAKALTRARQSTGRADGDPGAHGVVALDADGRVRGCTERAGRWLGEYFGALGHGRRLPDRLERWVTAHQRVLGQDDAPLPPAALVVEQAGGRLTARYLPGWVGDQALVLLEERRRSVARDGAPPFGLTPREVEVLRWVKEGKTNREIAAILDVSPLTVRTHLEHIFQKLGVETRTAAAVQGSRRSARPTGQAATDTTTTTPSLTAHGARHRVRPPESPAPAGGPCPSASPGQGGPVPSDG